MARRATPSDKPKSPRKDAPRAARRGKWGRRLLGGVGLGFVIFLLVWYAVHHFDWAGPMVANSLRAVFGDDNVARLEDFVYGAEDHVNRVLKKNEPPKAYWQVPGSASAAPVASVTSAPSSSSATIAGAG